MRLRNALALAALAFVLSACGSETITGPQLRADEAPASASIGWGGAGGRSADTTGGEV